MSENHRMPSPISIHPVNNINKKQKNDYNNLPNLMIQCSLNQRNEFGNREKYMETQLTEEPYNNCNLDTNANPNDILDDGPYPPYGLKRLVTGRTVSFEDGLSPPFDRVVTGEGNVFNNFTQAKAPKPEPNYINESKDISERYVFGSTFEEHSLYPLFTPSLPLPSKKENMNAYNTELHEEKNTYSSLDYLDNFMQNSAHNTENVSKLNQFLKSSTSSASNGFQNHERDFYQSENPVNVLNLSSSNFDESKTHISNASELPQGENNSIQQGSKSENTNQEAYFMQNYEPVSQFSNRHKDEPEPGMVIDQTIQFVQAAFQNNYIDQEELPNRDVLKEVQPNLESNVTEPHQPFTANMEVPSLYESISRDTNLKSPFRQNSFDGNNERIDSERNTLERRTVPGAQSTPNDNLPNRQFPNVNNSFYYGMQNVSRLENEPKINKQYSFDTSFNKSKIEPPLERRMVVGETSSDLPVTQTSNRSRDENQFDDKSRRIGGNLHAKDKESISGRYEKSRKKQMYDRRDRRKIESDDEDYEDYTEEPYDNSPEREYRSYHEKHYRRSPRRSDKRSSRRDHNNSFTQSQDESYYDDDDDEFDTYRNRHRYYDRRYQRDISYFYREDRNHRDRRPDYYSNRYEEDPYYRDGRNSRPSSRSGSEYRRDYPEYNYPRSYNIPYYDELDHRRILHYGGGPRLSKRDIDYWSKVREADPPKFINWFKVTFPKEYADWYSRHNFARIAQSNADRRGSGHSGQSSINNDDISVSEEKMMDMNRKQPYFKPVIAEINTMRSTPSKFTVPHVKGFFNPLGQLVMVNACSPLDGQSANINIYQISAPEDDMDYVEFINFTGPFIVGETHVNTLSEFVKYHANLASSSSKKLLYLLIDLIIKLRGVTDGIAISELLMESYRDSQKGNLSGSREDFESKNSASSSTELEKIQTYTELLLQGNKNAALELAIEQKLWGHAFLLASKMGQKHYSKVLAKFDSTIAMNNPLKTLYQLYSKQIPNATKACADDKWGDWRPHLAMILSNPTADKEFNKTAIITLGDSLISKDVFAAHFCYLTAQTDFDLPNKTSTKYTLLSLPNNADLGKSTLNHAILLTQTYEFAKRLQNSEFTIVTLLPYKFLLATRLVDYGRVSIALQYLETIALDLIRNPCDQELIRDVLELSEKLRFSDSKPLDAELSNEKLWIANLREIANENSINEVSQPVWNGPVCNETSLQQLPPQQFPPVQQIPANDSQQPLFISQPLGQVESSRQPWGSSFNSLDQRNTIPDYEQNQEQFNEPMKNNGMIENIPLQLNRQHDQKPVDNNQQNYSPWDVPQQPISISTHSNFNYFDLEEPKKSGANNNARNPKEGGSPPPPVPKETEKNVDKTKPLENGNNGGWLGGIFGKISLRPKNQMKLPDDKKPSIVWSEEKKRWVDVNEDNADDSSGAIVPPPKASELSNFQPANLATKAHEMSPVLSQNFGQNNPPMRSNNIYKLSRGKGMKANYVNVLSQNLKPAENAPPPPPPPPPPNQILPPFSNAQVSSNVKMFVPPSDGNTGSGDMSSNSRFPDNSQARNPPPDMPSFYNPAQYNSLG